MQCHVLRPLEKLVQTHRLDSEIGDSLRGQIRVRHQDIHPERLRPVHDLRADPAGPDDTERLPAQLTAPNRAPLPPARVHRSICCRDPTSGGQQQTER